LGEAVVITPNNSNQQDYKFPYEIYRYKSLFTFGEGYPVGWPFNEQLAKDVINMNCDILHSHCPISTSYFFRRINRQKRIPQVLTYHTKYEYDIEERVPSRAVKRFAYNFLLNNINSADEVWVTSNGTAESLRKIGYQGDFIVMPNGCDLPKVNATDEEIAIIRRKHNLPTDVPVFIFVGRMMWYKNTKLILDACKILDGRGMDFRMIMIGMGPDENAIKKYAKKLMLDNKVIFAGQITDREELQIYYSASDLLVFPSTFDTNGLVVREAAASATASLLVEDSCAAERIVDCDTGFLCVETAHAIARKIEDIMPNKDLIKRVGKKAQDDIYISWDDAVSNAFDRYHVVIDNFNSTNHDKYKY
jgi:glycosyltransferase involved in cell wall biosynthesis